MKRTGPTCRKCGKPIAFIRTAQGKSMPVEAYTIYAVEDRNGPLTVLNDFGRTVRAREAGPGDRGKFIGSIPHWIECEGAQEIKWEYGARKKAAAARQAAQIAAKKAAEQKAKSRPPLEQTEQLKLFGG